MTEPMSDERLSQSNARLEEGTEGCVCDASADLCPLAERIISDRLARVRAAVTLAAPDHITPTGQRVILAALNNGATDDRPTRSREKS